MFSQPVRFVSDNRSTHIIIIIILAIIIYILYKYRNHDNKFFTKSDTTVNVTPYDSYEDPPQQTNMQASSERLANGIKEQFPWTESEGMANSINTSLNGSLMIPNRSDLSLNYHRDIPRDRTILAGGMIKGEDRERRVAMNNSANIGTGSFVPLGQDSNYTRFQMAHANTAI